MLSSAEKQQGIQSVRTIEPQSKSNSYVASHLFSQEDLLEGCISRFPKQSIEENSRRCFYPISVCCAPRTRNVLCFVATAIARAGSSVRVTTMTPPPMLQDRTSDEYSDGLCAVYRASFSGAMSRTNWLRGLSGTFTIASAGEDMSPQCMYKGL